MRAVLVAVAALGLAASAQATMLFSFEGSLNGFAPDASTGVLANSTIGATEGTQSMSITHTNWGQLKVDLTPAQWADIAATKKISIDYTIPTTIWGSWGGWWGKLNLAVNSPNTGWIGTPETNLDLTPGTHTMTFDWGNASIPADGGDWRQLFFVHNWGAEKLNDVEGGPTGPSTLYVDNFRTVAVPEPTALVGIGVAALGLVRRRSK